MTRRTKHFYPFHRNDFTASRCTYEREGACFKYISSILLGSGGNQHPPHHLHRTINYTTFFFTPRTRNLKRSVAPILKRSPLIKIREYITRPAMNTKHPHLEAKRKKHYQPSNDSPIRSTIDLRESKGNGN